MNNGCICCTVRGDLIVALTNLADKRTAGEISFDHLIIETTGLANPGPVAQTFFVDEGVRSRTKLDAIVTVAEGGHYLSPAVSGYLIRRRNRAEQLAAHKPGLDDLTKAERRILKLVAGKKTSREIATELFISPRTVEAHRANICTKLDLHGSHSLLQFALENRSSL